MPGENLKLHGKNWNTPRSGKDSLNRHNPKCWSWNLSSRSCERNSVNMILVEKDGTEERAKTEKEELEEV